MKQEVLENSRILSFLMAHMPIDRPIEPNTNCTNHLGNFFHNIDHKIIALNPGIHISFLIRLPLIITAVFITFSSDAQECIMEDTRWKDSPIFLESGEMIWASQQGILSYNDHGIEKVYINYDGKPLTGQMMNIFKIDEHHFFHYRHHGLLHVTKDEKKLLRKDDYPGLAPDGGEINVIYRLGQSDTLLMGSTAGITLYDVQRKDFIGHIQPGRRTNLVENPAETSNMVQDIYPDHRDSNIFWLSGASGLFKMEMPHFKVTYIPFDQDLMRKYGLDNPGFYSMLLGDIHQNDDVLYFPSWAGGIISYNISNEQWQMYLYDLRRDLNPMAFNIVSKIRPFRDSLLICTRRDVEPAFFNMHTKEYIPFEQIAGVRPQEDPSLGIKRLGNSFFIGYYSAICRYELEDGQNHPEITPGIELGQMSSFKSELFEFTGLKRQFKRELENFQRTLDFSVYTYNTVLFDSVAMECKLEGAENTWRQLPGSGKITYTNLKGGNYNFQARLLMPDGKVIYSDEYPFYIEKYFWEELWFYLSIIGLLLAIFLPLAFYIRKNRQQRRQSELQHQIELSDTRLTALRAQMNPHFLFNSLSAINHHIIQADPRTASRYLTKFAHLMRRILNNSEQGFITLENELETLRLYIELEDFRYDHNIDYTVNVDPNISSSELYLPSMLLQPYIENAIRHGIMNKNASGKIDLSVGLSELNNKQVIIRIEDDGIGREAAKALKAKKVVKNKSMGLDITKNRIALLNSRYSITAEVETGDILDENGNIAGTEVLIQLPYISQEDIAIHEKA